jgi:hypothetical protein
MKTKIILIALLCLVGGCTDRFRYPCQDPNNWGNDECKKPACEVTRTCPGMILKENNISTAPVENKIDKKGDCK